MSKFMAVSRQAIKLDKTRVLLETRIQEVKDESKKWAEVAAKAKKKAKELENLVEEFRADAVEKDTRLDHLQKKNDELSTLLSKAQEDAVVEFKVSKQYTNLLYTGFCTFPSSLINAELTAYRVTARYKNNSFPVMNGLSSGAVTRYVFKS